MIACISTTLVHGNRACLNAWTGTYITVIRIGLLYPLKHNSLIANKRIEVKLAQNMMCAMYLSIMLFQMVIYFGGPK